MQLFHIHANKPTPEPNYKNDESKLRLRAPSHYSESPFSFRAFVYSIR